TATIISPPAARLYRAGNRRGALVPLACTQNSRQRGAVMDASTFQKKLATAFPGYLGVEFREVTAEKVTASLEVRPDMCNGGDILHGGAIMSLADTLGAVGTIVNLPKRARTTT